MRVFVAIDLPEDVREALVELQNALPVGRPVAPENLHLTLCFLGEQPEEAIEAAHDALSCIQRPAFAMQLADVGTFGRKSPNVVFADVAHCTALIDLEKTIVRSLRNAGLEFERRRFHPHVTLARLPKVLTSHDLGRLGGFLAENATFRSSGFSIEHFHLFHSTLMPEGAWHDILTSYDLITG